MTGERYVDMPNALKFQQSYDATCSCRRRGESWAETLAAAEAKYGHEAKDILVTPREVDRDVAPDHRQGLGSIRRRSRSRRRRRSTGRRPPRARRRRATRALPAPRQSLNANGEDTSAQRRRRDRQPRGLGHRRRVGAVGDVLQSGPGTSVTETGPDGRQRRSDSRASALARPMSGSSAASSGPDSRPVSARRSGW